MLPKAMVIPLEPTMYRLAILGEQTESRWRHLQYPAKTYRVDDRQNLISYTLERWAKDIVEGELPETICGHYTLEHIGGKGVCLIAPDHSFGRGLVRKLLGWDAIGTVFFREADAVETYLGKNAQARWITSSFNSDSSVSLTAFNFENEEDLILLQVAFDGIEARRSTLGEPRGMSENSRKKIPHNPEQTAQSQNRARPKPKFQPQPAK